jgi:hypothetical protein
MMNYVLKREDYIHRPVKTYAQAYGGPGPFQPGEEFLAETLDFIKLFRHLHQFTVTRRTLQLYSSPQLKLLPRPIHMGGHKSYYLNPEHTNRLAVVMHLATKLFLPLKTIQAVVRVYPEQHYDLILKGILTADELTNIVDQFERDFTVKDVLFFKVCRVLEALDEPYWDFMARHGKGANELAEKHVDQTIIKLTHELERWIKSDLRRRMGMDGLKK